MREKAAAIIVAAGMGERLARSRGGDDRPVGKALVEVFGVPMIAHSLRAFEAAEGIGKVVIVAREVDILGIYDIVRGMGITKVANIVPGGETRQESVLLGLSEIDKGFDFVAIHDCARPCIRAEKIDEIVGEVMATGEAATLGIRVTDTIKRVRDGVIEEDIEREGLWQMQTPQVFAISELRRAHEAAVGEGLVVTDDTAVMQHYGGRVRILEGDMENIKIATVEDLLMVERILGEREIEG